jgi:outer membrane protein assembly factor BamB
MGPSSLYTATITILENQTIRIEGRDSTGEWVYLCCQDNIDGWVRQAFLLLKDNVLPPGAPTTADPNDVRWLALRQPTVAPPMPVPTSTPISEDEYPLYRRTPGNQAWESTMIQPPLVYAWPDPGQASRAMSSPVVVSGFGVYAASEDSHFYSFEKATGNQRWRYTLNRVVRMAPAIKDTTIFAVDMSGRVYALQDQGNQAGLVWQNDLGIAPSDGINLWGNLLYVPGANHHLYALDQATGTVKWDYPTSGNYLHYPAVGNQLIFVGDGQISALDALDGSLIWTQDIPVGAPPVYAWPGTVALAELYVADELGNIYAFDANTGKQLWKSAGNTRADGLAVDSTTVYASGVGYVKALDRRDGSLLWEVPITVKIVGGPIVAGTRLVIAGQGGFVQIFDAEIGIPIGNAIVPSQVMGAPAVTREWIFVPAGDGNLYALKGSG